MFVNEKISSEDRKKFNLDEIDKGRGRSTQWTIDRERNIYLWKVWSGREEYYYHSTWIFSWNGYLSRLEIENIKIEGDVNGDRVGYLKLVGLECDPALESRRKELIKDLATALEAYSDGGIYATAKSYKLVLDVVC